MRNFSRYHKYTLGSELRSTSRRILARIVEANEGRQRVPQLEGLSATAEGGPIRLPWSWPLLEEVRQWLNSYLGYLGKASTRRLLDQIRKRHVWLSEYFLWGGNKVDFRCPTPRLALRFAYQVGWFEERLPDHVLIIQKGLWWTLPTWTYIAPAGEVPGARRHFQSGRSLWFSAISA